jgi:hypothetical protein
MPYFPDKGAVLPIEDNEEEELDMAGVLARKRRLL